jgi:hypothetical protein
MEVFRFLDFAVCLVSLDVTKERTVSIYFVTKFCLTGYFIQPERKGGSAFLRNIGTNQKCYMLRKRKYEHHLKNSRCKILEYGGNYQVNHNLL